MRENNRAADEERVHKRHSLRIQTKITAETLSGKTPLMEFLTANISAGGAMVETDRPLPLASKVRLDFLFSLEDLQILKFILSLKTLKSWKKTRIWIKATGIVVRHESNGMGIMFDENYQISPMGSDSTTTLRDLP